MVSSTERSKLDVKLSKDTLEERISLSTEVAQLIQILLLILTKITISPTKPTIETIIRRR